MKRQICVLYPPTPKLQQAFNRTAEILILLQGLLYLWIFKFQASSGSSFVVGNVIETSMIFHFNCFDGFMTIEVYINE